MNIMATSESQEPPRLTEQHLPLTCSMDKTTLEQASDASPSMDTMSSDRRKNFSRGVSQVTLYGSRRISKIQAREEREGERSRCLTKIREIVENYAHTSKLISPSELEVLFHNRQLSSLLFILCDDRKSGVLHQQTWIEGMKGSYESFTEAQSQRVIEFVELLETITYLICKDDDVGENEFGKIWSTKGLSVKFSRIMDPGGTTTVEHFMEIVMKITASRSRDKSVLNNENIDWLENVFKSKAGDENELDLDQFKSIYPSKHHFFVERCFKIFDKDSNGKVSLPEFIETMHQFSEQGEEEKISFLFKIYDLNNSGTIDENETEEMMKASMKESGLELPTKDIKDLSKALYQDAVREGCDGITIEDLKIQLKKYGGLIESMNLGIDHLLVVPKPGATKSNCDRASISSSIYFLSNYWINNKAFIFFLLFFILFNAGLFIHRAHYFTNFRNLDGSTPNVYYMISRGCGRVLLFNSVLVVILVLRHSITSLRNTGFGKFLPLDHNIYLHKIVGWVIGCQSFLHTVMHLFNFGRNVQPDPIRFVYLNIKYWNVSELGYNMPNKCSINESSFDDSGLKLNQVCESGSTPWSYSDWIMTMKPGVFGLIGGVANPTGVALIMTIAAMTLFSLPFIRRSGYFQLFYYTHMLYILYFILLILHAPDFWKWIIGPGVIFLFEQLFKLVNTYLGHGRTVIREGVILPSKVTKLVIERQPDFIFKTGDWVFVKIPELVGHEWHPFTISSSPELLDTMTLHIRAVGGWTNELYRHFQEKMQKHQDAKAKLGKSLSTYVSRKKQNSMKHPKSQSLKSSPSKNILNIQTPDTERQEERMNARRESLMENGTYFEKQLKHLDIYIDGPFGSPSSDIYRAEHAVLICTGIGVTPYASILQSIMMRYRSIKHYCPNCEYQWANDLSSSMFSLKKVDFIWVNRDQKSFEWFIQLLSQLEVEQSELGGAMGRFLEMHMYMTSALQKTDMKAVLLQMALDLIHKKEKIDILTGLQSRTNAGRPNWNKVFTKVREQNKGRVTVFYCGNPGASKILKEKCAEFGFTFKKETF